MNKKFPYIKTPRQVHNKLDRIRPVYRHNRKLSKWRQAETISRASIATVVVALFVITIAMRPDSPSPTAQSSSSPSEANTSTTTPIAPQQQYRLTTDDVAWPSTGRAAVGVLGSGVLAGTHPDDQQVPMASLAKVVTTLTLLEEQPLALNETGPSILFSQEDEAIYNDYVFRNGSVLPVEAGKSIHFRDVLESLLIKSANNIADTAVNDVFGSVENYLTRADKKLAELNLNNISVADATGFSPDSKASAQDLVLLGEIALGHPVVAEIAQTWQADIDGIGEIYNTNNFLDFEDNGVIGIKTGDTDEAGGTYLVAAKRIVAGEEVIIIIAILGGENHFTAQSTAMPLIDDVARKLAPVTP